MNKFNKYTCSKLGKRAINALNNSKSVDDFIALMSEPVPIKNTPSKIKVQQIVKRTGKPVCDGFRGIVNPNKLNISTDTLTKLNKRIDN